ncbi:MAG: cation:proton antiporter [Myxococcales bacterium]|nr:cation:proton antiporter [Myxococcales bacterium]
MPGEETLSLALAALAIMLVTARLGGELATRLGQPAVLGELGGGVLLGSLPLLGVWEFEWLGSDPFVALLAEVGVVLLLFSVGLESTLGQMARVGRSASAVALLGVIAPFGLGVAVGLLFDRDVYVCVFLGAILTATSVGITARVLRDLGAIDTPEARVILGAAVIDDVLGLALLAVVTAVIAAVEAGGSVHLGPVLWIGARAVGFLAGAVLLGVYVVPRVLGRLAALRGSGVMLGFTLAFCFAMAWAAGHAGLAPIVGAFAAGLVLEAAHYQPFASREPRQVEDLVEPIVHMLAPIFFVRVGLGVDLGQLTSPPVLLLGLALTAAAVLGKAACMAGVLDRSIRRVAVGVGMIPRGEVGLVFATTGAGLLHEGRPLIDPPTFSAVVLMVMVTTAITPALLSWAMRRAR